MLQTSGYDVMTVDTVLDPQACRDTLAGRGIHSSSFRLNVSTFCGIRRVHDFPPVY
jgi:hypothetical protein